MGTVTLPEPEPGLVIRYAYLWHREFLEGREDGVKDRPCAIVMISEDQDDGRTRVWVVPVSHVVPDDPDAAIELPPALKRHLNLDSERSWAVLSETNDFLWPGPDLRRVGSESDASVVYGYLPPNFFAALRKKMSSIIKVRRKLKHVRRTE